MRTIIKLLKSSMSSNILKTIRSSKWNNTFLSLLFALWAHNLAKVVHVTQQRHIPQLFASR